MIHSTDVGKIHVDYKQNMPRDCCIQYNVINLQVLLHHFHSILASIIGNAFNEHAAPLSLPIKEFL